MIERRSVNFTNVASLLLAGSVASRTLLARSRAWAIRSALILRQAVRFVNNLDE